MAVNAESGSVSQTGQDPTASSRHVSWLVQEVRSTPPCPCPAAPEVVVVPLDPPVPTVTDPPPPGVPEVPSRPPHAKKRIKAPSDASRCAIWKVVLGCVKHGSCQAHSAPV